MHVETCLRITHFDPYRRPYTGEEVHVRLILRWRLFSRAEKWPVGTRAVLHRMVPSLLIVCAAIRRTQAQTLECSHIVLHPKGDADEAARGLLRSGRRGTGDHRRDYAVGKLEPLDNDQGLSCRVLS